MKKVLVIGGSYFLGRVFTMLYAPKEDWNLTLLNRGRYSMARYGVTELHVDRHDATALKVLLQDQYDAVIDFCAYRPEDISFLLENFPFFCGQYIFISTCDVYRRGSGLKDESSPLEERVFGGENGEYIHNKVLLEKELRQACFARQIPFTVLRPAAVYGPYNYAPREGMLVNRIARGLPLHLPQDCGGSFQLVYVKDVAFAIGRTVKNPMVYNRAFNLCSPRRMTYRELFELLAKNVPVEPVIESCDARYITSHPEEFPFPVTEEESQWYDGAAVQQVMGVDYTPEEEGMARAVKAFWNVYGRQV